MSRSRTAALLSVIAVAAGLISSCASTDVAAPTTSDVATVVVTETVGASTAHSAAPQQSAAPMTVTTPVIPTVAEGGECGPIGTTAVFADGTTAYCARLAGTDDAVWSRNASLAPNPALADSGVAIGMKCIGADIGKIAYDAAGTQLICTDYQWQVNVGQTPEHSWADGQREWTECIKVKTTEQCREELNN